MLQSGLELELLLIDEEGIIQNKAEEVLNHPYNYQGYILKESSKATVEVIAPPSDSLQEVQDYFFTNLKTLVMITDELGLFPIPASTVSADTVERHTDSTRYAAIKRAVGHYNSMQLSRFSGTHIHTDLVPESKDTQFFNIHASDPIFGLTAASPFYNCQNSLHDYRVHNFRNILFDGLLRYSELTPFPGSLELGLSKQREDFALWSEYSGTNEGFSEYNCNWSPLRITKKTIEARACDAHLPSVVVALAAFYKGISTATLPKISFAQLKSFERISTHEGLKNSNLSSYIGMLLDTSAKQLGDEAVFLEPLYKLYTDGTLATKLMKYASQHNLEHNKRITQEGAHQINRYLADVFRNDVLG